MKKTIWKSVIAFMLSISLLAGAAAAAQVSSADDSGYQNPVKNIWEEAQESTGFEELVSQYGAYPEAAYDIAPQFDEDKEAEASFAPDPAQYDLTTVVVSAEALSEEDQVYVDFDLDDYYVLSFDSEEEAAQILDKYQNQDGAEAFYDAYAEIFDDGSGYYTYHSWGAETIGTAEFSAELLKKYGSADQIPQVKVGIIDSGVNYEHSFLADRVIAHAYDYYDNDGDAMDEHGHGSHVAGTITDMTLPNVKILAYKITNAKGSTSATRLTKAINQAVSDGADFLNISLGGEAYEIDAEGNKVLKESVRIVYEALDRAVAAGTTVMIAAGNSGRDVEDIYPANYAGAITVSALDTSGETLAGYSNYGTIDLCAPGSSIYSAYTPGNAWKTDSGTSMAAPHVTAAGALVKSYYPSYGNSAITSFLTQNAYDLGPDGYDNLYGYGRVDLTVKTAAPSISPAEGEYEAPVNVTLSYPDRNADIYYTLDGTVPDGTSIKYTGPFTVDHSALLQVIALHPGKDPSEVESVRYYIQGECIESDFTVDGNGVITDYSGLQTVMSIPESIKGQRILGIGERAFSKDRQLREITIPEGITQIGKMAFDTENQLTVWLEGSLREIGDYPFGFDAEVFYYYEAEGMDLFLPYSYSLICMCQDHRQHTMELKTVKEPTCTEAGSKMEVCTVCGYQDESTAEEVESLGHEMTAHEESPAGCDADGSIAYWHCGRCDGYYADEEGTLPISEGSWVIPAGHDLVFIERLAPTCLDDGMKPHWQCLICGALFLPGENGLMETDFDEIRIPCALAHEPVVLPAVPATCTSPGLTEGAYCAVCKEVLTVQEVIPATGHQVVVDEGVLPSCTQPGLTQGSHCSVCGETLVEQKTIPAAGHVPVATMAVPATCEETGLSEGSVCLLCGEILEEQQVVPALGHDLEYHAEKPAACTQIGWYAYETCRNCDYTTYVEIPALGHSYVLTAEAEPVAGQEEILGEAYPDSEEPSEGQEGIPEEGQTVVLQEYVAPVQGYREYTCSTCGDVYYEYTHAAGDHPMVPGGDSPATCTQAGWGDYYICTDPACQVESYTQIPAAGHTLIHYNHAPATCTQDGNVDYWQCSVCGLYFVESGGALYEADWSQIALLATGHTPAVLAGAAAGCHTGGLTDGSYCADCGVLLAEQSEIPAAGHSFDEGVITLEPACFTGGLKVYTCQICLSQEEEYIAPDTVHVLEFHPYQGEDCENPGNIAYFSCSCGKYYIAREGALTEADYETQIVIEAAGHEEVEDPQMDATCTLPGITAGSHCGKCGKSIVLQTEIAPLGHSHEEGNILKEATCTQTGLEEFTCVRCGETWLEILPMKEHTPEVVPGKEPEGCTGTGLTEGSVCSECGEVLTAQEVIPARGHQVVTDAYHAPTCTQPGLTEGSHCSECGIVFIPQEEIEAIGHTPQAISGRASTCTESGLTDGRKCTVCGEILTAQEVVAPHGHNWVTTPATCVKDGREECSVCGESFVIPMTGHSLAAVPRVEPTLNQEGREAHYRCEVCGDLFLDAEGELPTFEDKLILPRLISITQATVAGIKHQIYTGQTLTQKPKVTIDGTTLKKDVDYVLSVKYPAKTGKGTVTIKGIGKYAGTLKKTFKVNSMKVILSEKYFTWNGKAQKPEVTVKVGTKILSPDQYKLSWYKGRKNPGTYKVKVTLKGDYSGTKKAYFRIVPKGTKIASLSPGKRALTVNWKKQAKHITGYQVQYSTNKAFSSKKTVTVKKPEAISTKLKGLRSKTAYYVRIRTYTKVNGKNYYSAWSAAKKVTTK